MTDYKQMCAELLNRLQGLYDELVDSEMGWVPPEAQELMTRARAALAEPEPEGPTDADLHAMAFSYSQPCYKFEYIPFARSVLARWGK
jgi:hypothetical protein